MGFTVVYFTMIEIVNQKKFIELMDEYSFKVVDIKKLRPNKSYETLFNNRDYLLQVLKDENDQIPRDILEYCLCTLCDSTTSLEIMKKDGFSIVECSNCQLVYVNPRLKKELYLESYMSHNYGHVINELALSSHEYRKKRFGQERVEFIECYLDLNLKKELLDIGSASGFFMEAAAERGWSCTGIELSQVALDFSRKRGNNVLSQPLENLDFQRNAFSVVTMFDVLEHLHNPDQTLQIIGKILQPGGLLYIYVPNWNSASRLLIGQDSHFIWPTHHLTYFTPKTISLFLQKYGFEIVAMETNGLDFEDWNWQLEEQGVSFTFFKNKLDELQFLANSAGWGKNLRVMARKSG